MDSKLTLLIKEDSVLPEHIKSVGDISKASECKVILLTGATGNLGPYLLKNLLERSQLKIYCLVRKLSLQLARDILDGFAYIDGINDRVMLLPGDLSSENFGIGIAEYVDLCSEVDAVIHGAVKSNHLENYKKELGKQNDLRSINVLGTLKIMEFATTGKMKRIFHASSILGCNRINEEENVLSEELIEEDNYGDGIVMGYAISKFICDKLMSQAIRKSIPCFVCRFPIIIGDSHSGLMNLRNNHYFYIIMSLFETGMKPDFPSAYPAIPVDICAKISIDLFFNDVPDGIYNLMNPHKLSKEDVFVNIPKMFGIPPLRKVSFKEFSSALAAQGEKSSLYPFKMLYFDEDAEEILASLNFPSKLALTEEGGTILESISKKLRKYIPEIEDCVDKPDKLFIKVLSVGRDAGYL